MASALPGLWHLKPDDRLRQADQAPQAVPGLSRPSQDQENPHQADAPHWEDHHNRALHTGCCDCGGIGNSKRRDRSSNGQDNDSEQQGQRSVTDTG